MERLLKGFVILSFSLLTFCVQTSQVLPCSKRYCHDWTTCPFSHPGEKARRRDPRTQPHTGIACPDRKKVCCEPFSCYSSCVSLGVLCWSFLFLINSLNAQEGTCVRGDNCPYAHNVFEYWLHPTRYLVA